MLIGKFIGKIKSDDNHSNEYAKRTVSTQSFQDRQVVDKNRAFIGNYRQSMTGQQHAPHSGTYKEMEEKKKRFKLQLPSRQGINTDLSANTSALQGAKPQQSINTQQRSFQEPQNRGYNPYQ